MLFKLDLAAALFDWKRNTWSNGRISVTKNESNITLFPNPSDSQVQFFNLPNGSTIEVYNQNGQRIDYQIKISNESFFLHIRNWLPGLYIVRITGETNTPISLKLIKQ